MSLEPSVVSIVKIVPVSMGRRLLQTSSDVITEIVLEELMVITVLKFLSSGTVPDTLRAGGIPVQSISTPVVVWDYHDGNSTPLIQDPSIFGTTEFIYVLIIGVVVLLAIAICVCICCIEL